MGDESKWVLFVGFTRGFNLKSHESLTNSLLFQTVCIFNLGREKETLQRLTKEEEDEEKGDEDYVKNKMNFIQTITNQFVLYILYHII